MSNLRHRSKILDELAKDPTNPKTLVVNDKVIKSPAREVYFSNTINLLDVKEKAELLKVSINDLFLGSVTKAIKDFHEGTEEKKVQM